MPTWNADQYLKFVRERTQPCRDLAWAIAARQVRRVADLGCGPGNSTSVLAERWPDVQLTGVDNSVAMIEVARREQPQHTWIVRDIADWAAHDHEQFDVVFSNAALHWVPDHASLYPMLLKRVRPEGTFAVQVPSNSDALPHRLMRELARPDARVKEWHVHEPGFYYDLLAPYAARVDIWETEYQHVLPNAEAIVEWYKGSGMRPFLETMSESEQENFLTNYRERIRESYRPRPDGKVLFPFRRLFVVAVAA